MQKKWLTCRYTSLDIVESKIETKRTAKSFKDIFNQPLKVDFLFTSWKKGGFKCLIL